MSSLERLRDAGKPTAPSIERAVEVIAASTLAQRPGFAKDGKVIRGNVEIAVLTTAALDLPLIQALDYVYIVNNTAQLYAKTQRILARRAGYDMRFPDEEQTEEVGTAYIRYGERGGWRKVTFTAAQARTANLLDNDKKDNWRHYVRDMLTARACTRAISRYAEEVKAGMDASGVWSDDDDERPTGGVIAPSGVTIPAASREPEIDEDIRDDILERVSRLPDDQVDWLRREWRDTLGAPNLRRGWLSAAHGRLLQYMVADAEDAAATARRPADDDMPREVHDDAPEAGEAANTWADDLRGQGDHEEDDPGRPF